MKKILSILVILSLIGIASAEQPTVIGSKTVWSENNFFGFNWGDYIEEVTYSDGSTEQHYIRFLSLAKPAFIKSLQTSVTDKFLNVPITLRGVSCMFGSPINDHTLISTDADTGNGLGQQTYSVPCNADYNGQFTVQITGRPTTIKVEEYMMLKGTRVSGDTVYISVNYPATPTPTQTISPTQTSCSDGTFYNQCSSQKPLYCYYGSLMNKASQCGCPTGQTPSGDICIAVTATTTPTATPTATETPYPCVSGYLYDPASDDCVKIQQGIPGFESILALIGLIATAGYILRRKKQ